MNASIPGQLGTVLLRFGQCFLGKYNLGISLIAIEPHGINTPFSPFGCAFFCVINEIHRNLRWVSKNDECSTRPIRRRSGRETRCKSSVPTKRKKNTAPKNEKAKTRIRKAKNEHTNFQLQRNYLPSDEAKIAVMLT